ncbi:MAG: hypothetical protein ACTSRU_16145 [Candidatus Hodarchaeales archaeon]
MNRKITPLLLSMIVLSFILISNLQIHSTSSSTINSSDNDDSDGDGIPDLLESYHSRNISLLSSSSGITVISSWYRPPENMFNLSGTNAFYYPGYSGNVMIVEIPSEGPLSINYTFDDIQIRNNFTNYHLILKMNVQLLSIVEFSDINGNKEYDTGDELVSQFNTNSTSFSSNFSTAIIDNENSHLVSVHSNDGTFEDQNSTIELLLLFSERFFRLPRTNITAIPVNVYMFIIYRYPFQRSNSYLAAEMLIEWPEKTDTAYPANITDQIWENSYYHYPNKIFFNSHFYMDTDKTEHVFSLFSWNDQAVNNQSILDIDNRQISQVKASKSLNDEFNIRHFLLNYPCNNVIQHSIHFGFLSEITIPPEDKLVSYSVVNNVFLISLIPIIMLFRRKKTQCS